MIVHPPTAFDSTIDQCVVDEHPRWLEAGVDVVTAMVYLVFILTEQKATMVSFLRLIWEVTEARALSGISTLRNLLHSGEFVA